MMLIVDIGFLDGYHQSFMETEDHLANSLRQSIETLTKELEIAQENLVEASEKRVQAHARENEWMSEVSSLKQLIEVRSERLRLLCRDADGVVRLKPEIEIAMVPGPNNSTMVFSMIRSDHAYTSTTDWICRFVEDSGERGATPPEILDEAKKVGKQFHHNYTYAVLRSLVDRGRLAKRDGRYFKKG